MNKWIDISVSKTGFLKDGFEVYIEVYRHSLYIIKQFSIVDSNLLFHN